MGFSFGGFGPIGVTIVIVMIGLFIINKTSTSESGINKMGV
jgi:hypothetical protein